MKRANKLGWVNTTAIILPFILPFCIVSLLWLKLDPADRLFLIQMIEKHIFFAFGILLFLMVGAGFYLVWIFRKYINPITRMAEELELIQFSNPSHRIQFSGSEHIRRLIKGINTWAAIIESDQNQLDDMITRAKTDSEIEKNILATFMAELHEGMLVCNQKGKILLYNRQAKRFLSGQNTPASSKARSENSYHFIGLGRWASDVIDSFLIRHAIDEVKAKLKNKEPDVTAYFVFNKHQRMLRVEMVPVLNHMRTMAGFILILNDITDQIQRDGRTQFLWQSITRQFRSTVTSVRSAIETLMDYPDLASNRKTRLQRLIHTESVRMGEVLDAVISEYQSCCTDSRWPLVHIQDIALLKLIQKKTSKRVGLDIRIIEDQSLGWVRVDTYSLSLAVVFVVAKLKKALGQPHFDLRLKRAGRFIALDILWAGDPVKIELIKRWENQAVALDKEGLPFTLKEVMGYHHIDLGSYPNRGKGDASHIRFFMPAYDSPQPKQKRSVAILPESRSTFFDFDLFHQQGQHPDLDIRRLDQLTYTVFDLETTGLDINHKDRIVSIGAVRIVNGKLLKSEQFNQLVDPGIPIPSESTQFHGITDAMVVGHPPIETVLPLFYDFADETILIAHNAAFDMRLLEINERYTGLKFINPVLDTLLLSAVLHPSHGDHELESISSRLGVSVHNRHTALGDALTTAEIFLKLLPLLADRGIHTLKDAREASQQTYLARLKY